MLLYSVETVPFESPRKREIHFYRHGNEFGAANEFDYERMAAAISMSAPSRSDIPEDNVSGAIPQTTSCG